jgi:hypothetical protein
LLSFYFNFQNFILLTISWFHWLISTEEHIPRKKRLISSRLKSVFFKFRFKRACNPAVPTFGARLVLLSGKKPRSPDRKTDECLCRICTSFLPPSILCVFLWSVKYEFIYRLYGKDHTTACYKDTEGCMQLCPFLTSTLDRVCGQRHGLAALLSEKSSDRHSTEAGWTPGPNWNGVQKKSNIHGSVHRSMIQ